MTRQAADDEERRAQVLAEELEQAKEALATAESAAARQEARLQHLKADLDIVSG